MVRKTIIMKFNGLSFVMSIIRVDTKDGWIKMMTAIIVISYFRRLLMHV